MIHMSLFSGIGGFELAAEWMGWDNMVSCEINDFGRKVLDYYWPNSYHHDDIHTLTYDRINEELTQRYGTDWRSDDIILTGGFPCQPYSAAGKRLGKEDDRHLWPQMCRIIREVRPTWVVGENVLGLVNWNDGLVFDEVQADLEAEGYEVQPYVLPAAGVGAPHRRDRVWFVAHNSRQSTKQKAKRGREKRGREWSKMGSVDSAVSQRGTTTDTEGLGRGWRGSKTSSKRQDIVFESGSQGLGNGGIAPDTHRDGHDEQSKTGNNAKRKNNKQSRSQRISTVKRPCNEWDASDTNLRKQRADWRDFPTQPPVRSRNDGLSSELVGITVSKHRNESIKAYGNAIVPQVAHQIFKAIQQYKDQQP